MGALFTVILSYAGMALIIGGTVFVLSVLPIIIGTVMLHTTKRRKRALRIRLFGLIAFVPSLILGFFIVAKIVTALSNMKA